MKSTEKEKGAANMRAEWKHKHACGDERPNNIQLQYEIDYETLGCHMRAVRKAIGCTQAQLADVLGLRTNYYGQYETGKRHINIPRFIQFVCTTQCSADELLLGCHKEYPSVLPTKPGCSEARKELDRLLDKCDDDLLTDLTAFAQIMLKYARR